MELGFRSARVTDLERASELVTDRFLYDPEAFEAVRAYWRDLTSSSGLSAAVYAEREPDVLLAFGFAAFIGKDRAAALRTEEPPGIARRFMREWSRGKSPFLDRAQVARENATAGVDIVVLHHGYAADVESALGRELVLKLGEAFLACCAGLRVASFTHELYLKRPLADIIVANAGMQWREHGPHALLSERIPFPHKPIVGFCTSDDARAAHGIVFSKLICRSVPPPRLHLTELDQRLIRLALDCGTDDSIASDCELAASTVKKHFAAMYRKAESANVLSRSRGHAAPNGSRGPEVRRAFLEYVREHREELQPYAFGAGVP